jgi:hypothetical protein
MSEIIYPPRLAAPAVDSVGSAQIVDGEVMTVDLDDGAVTEAKLAAAVVNKLPIVPVDGPSYAGSAAVVYLDGLSPIRGESYVVTGGGGTPVAPGSDTLADGDTAEWDGSAWKKTVSNVGGYPPNGTRALVGAAAFITLQAPAAGNGGKIAEWDGTSLTPTFTAPAASQTAVVRSGAATLLQVSYSTLAGGVWAPTGYTNGMLAGALQVIGLFELGFLLGPGLTDGPSGLAADFGVGAGKVTQGNDSRLSDSRDPNDHATNHTDGTDDVATMGGDVGSGGTKGLVPAPATGDGAAYKVLRADGNWQLPGVAQPIVSDSIGSDQHNYSPTGLATAQVLRLNVCGTPSTKQLTGIEAQGDGRVIYVWNRGTRDLELVDESVSSTGANRFALNANITVAPDQAVVIAYDGDSERWRVMGR